MDPSGRASGVKGQRRLLCVSVFNGWAPPLRGGGGGEGRNSAAADQAGGLALA